MAFNGKGIRQSIDTRRNTVLERFLLLPQLIDFVYCQFPLLYAIVIAQSSCFKISKCPFHKLVVALWRPLQGYVSSQFTKNPELLW